MNACNQTAGICAEKDLVAMSREELKAEVRAIENTTRLFNDRRKQCRSLIADKIAEFQIGERVNVRKMFGKETLQLFEITNITLGFSDRSVTYRAKRINKDGSLGKVETDIYLPNMLKVSEE
ncbi:MAG: hypothetical protein M1492_03500 [Gammaproteobacteria bacterium]|nr:hypothetical protein [Gammaproteobacteria bacterium]